MGGLKSIKPNQMKSKHFIETQSVRAWPILNTRFVFLKKMCICLIPDTFSSNLEETKDIESITELEIGWKKL